MGDKVNLKLDLREVYGKKVKKLRQQGLVPGIVYGAGVEPVAVQVERGELRRVVQAAGRHTPVHLTGATKRLAMIKDITYNPVKTGSIRHISFHAVRADEPVRAEVPVRLVGLGETEAERAGLIILQAIEQIEVRALPADLPEAIEVDVTSLVEAGQRATLGDAKLPDGVEFVERDDGRRDDGDEDEERQTISDLVVANVYEPAALEAANQAAAGDAEDESAVETEGQTSEGAEAEAGDDKSEAETKSE